MGCLVRSQDNSFHPGFERTRVDPFEPCMKMIRRGKSEEVETPPERLSQRQPLLPPPLLQKKIQ